MTYFSKIIFVLCILAGSFAKAEFTWDTGLLYYSNGMKHETESKSGITFWNTSFNISIGKSKQFYAGWSILGLTDSSEADSEEKKYTSTEMGPRFMYSNKKGTSQIAISYHLRNTTKYKSGSDPEETLTGNTLFAEISYMPEISDRFRLGVKLNYYAATFAEKLVNETTYSQVSYNKTMIFPSLAMSLRW